MAGHHVIWLPGADAEIALIRRILLMLESTPAARVAAMLTTEGIPSPDANRTRCDGGVLHQVSGVWHQTTIVNIARNPLLRALTQYGLRSMGDQLRYSPTGPREVEDSDFHVDKKPKVIRNPECDRTIAKAHFDPLVDLGQHEGLLRILDARAGTQRGKPRSRKPDDNPLGGRVFDLACTWPMYRAPYQKSFRYTCGLYGQSRGAKCRHNHVPGPLAAEFALSVLRQRVLSPTLLPKLIRRLEELSAGSAHNSAVEHELAQKAAALTLVTSKLEKVATNMALADTPIQLKAIQKVFNELHKQSESLKADIAQLKARTTQRPTTTEVDAAIALAERLTELAKGPGSLKAATEAIALVDLKLYLRFEPEQKGKRTLNKLVGGIVTVGAVDPPVVVYDGRTDHRSVKANGSVSVLDTEPADPKSPSGSSKEDESLGNVNRGDKTAIELFLRGLAGWDAGLRRQMDHGNSKQD